MGLSLVKAVFVVIELHRDDFLILRLFLIKIFVSMTTGWK